jgi:hypothetical protein
MSMKNSNETIGKWTRNRPAFSVVPQLRHRVPHVHCNLVNRSTICFCVTFWRKAPKHFRICQHSILSLKGNMFFFVAKGPAADATDAPQPWGLLLNPVMKMISFLVFPHNGVPVEWNWQGKTRNTRGITCPSATLSTTNPTWTDPGSNPGLRGKRPATNRLSRGTARNMLHEIRNNTWSLRCVRQSYDYKFIDFVRYYNDALYDITVYSCRQTAVCRLPSRSHRCNFIHVYADQKKRH